MFNQSFTISGSSLKLLKVGEQGVVSGLSCRNDNLARKLRSMGLMPGKQITLEQRFPRFVVRSGLERFALDDTMIRAIYVRITGQQQP
jgi:ferrous iron transport protein A